tara:strand:- start:141 stop:1028 length:888 start_codon:yes stop_codon:yes gene_type:complete
MLVTTNWLNDHLSDSSLRIFDCTGIMSSIAGNTGREEHYDKHHIPGAAYLEVADAKGILTNPDGTFPFSWPSTSQFESAMREIGVSNECKVVLYTATAGGLGSGYFWATRAWWLMDYFGVDCAVLDGGWKKWESEGLPVETETRSYAKTNFEAATTKDQSVAFKDDVLAALNSDSALIVDTLSKESYLGKGDNIYGSYGKRAGHITGAINIGYEKVINPETGCFRDPDEIRTLYSGKDFQTKKPIITYCGGGIGATLSGFALKLAGFDDVAVYDGSLYEWTADPKLPMTNPSEAG